MTLFPFDFGLKKLNVGEIPSFKSFRGNPIPKALMNKIDEYIPDEFFVDLLHVFKVTSLIYLLLRESIHLLINITFFVDHRTQMLEMKSSPAPGYTLTSWTTTSTWNHTRMMIRSMVNTIHGVPVIFLTSAIYP